MIMVCDDWTDQKLLALSLRCSEVTDPQSVTPTDPPGGPLLDRSPQSSSSLGPGQVMETSRDHEELRGLDLVLRHVCNRPVELTSVTNALYSLLISQRHGISRVSKICLQYLLEKVNHPVIVPVKSI